MTPEAHAQAVLIMSDLLHTSLLDACGNRGFLYCWERDALTWLAEHKSGHPMNGWTADRLAQFKQGEDVLARWLYTRKGLAA